MGTRNVPYDERIAAERGYKYVGCNADWCVGAWSVDENGEGERYGIVILDQEDGKYMLIYATTEADDSRFERTGSRAYFTIHHVGSASYIFSLAAKDKVLARIKERGNDGKGRHEQETL